LLVPVFKCSLQQLQVNVLSGGKIAQAGKCPGEYVRGGNAQGGYPTLTETATFCHCLADGRHLHYYVIDAIVAVAAVKITVFYFNNFLVVIYNAGYLSALSVR